MIIRALHLQNYRRYADQVIEFPDSLIGIVGSNGSGKSTLIEAIGWCLYGNVASRTNKDCIRKTGAPANEDCKVALEMVIGGDSIRIERELRGKNANGMARLYLNGSDRAEVQGMKEVTDYVERRMGMDHLAFFTSVFARQKELNALSDMDAGERKKVIMRLLRIDRVDVAISNIRADIKGSREKIDLLMPMLKDPDELARIGDELHSRKEDELEAIAEAKKASIGLMQALENAKKDFAAQEKKLRAYNKSKQALASLESRYHSKEEAKRESDGDLDGARAAETALDKLRPEVSEFKQVEKDKEALDGLQLKFNEMKSLERQIQELEPKVRAREELNSSNEDKLKKFAAVDSELKTNKKNQRSMENQRDSLNARINRLKEKISQFGERKSELEDEFEKIKSLGKDGKCPTCKRELGDHLPVITNFYTVEVKRLKDAVAKAKEQKDGLSESVKSLTAQIDNLKEEENSIRERIKERVALKGRLKESKTTLKEMKKQLSGLRTKLKKYGEVSYDSALHSHVKARHKTLKEVYGKAMKLEGEVKKIPTLVARSKALEQLISKLDDRIKLAGKTLDGIGFDNEAYERSKTTKDEANKAYGAKREEAIQLQGAVEKTQLLIEQNDETIRDQKEKRKTIEEEQKKIESRSKLEKLMGEFRLDLIARIRPSLSARASELFRQITKGKYPSMDLDDNYELKIEDNGEEFGIDRFSGGESDLANLCLRIAISQELSERAGGASSGFIALDEVFGSQDSERKGEIMKALAELSNQFRQILLITHVEDVRESLPYVLNVKDDGNGAVKIETEGTALNVPVQAG